MIKRTRDGKYVLYSLSSGKKLGQFNSIEAARFRERQIQYFKSKNPKVR